MSTESNKTRLQNYINTTWNQHDLSVIDDALLPEFVDHTLPPGSQQGPAGQRAFLEAYLQGFPDTHIDLNEMVAEGDTVVLRWTATGTHTGNLMGIPASGKSMNLPGIALWRFRDGRLIECWNHFDQVTLLQQIGVMQAQAGG
jgi:steroid delta-isomerase-like uncharacterized protein